MDITTATPAEIDGQIARITAERITVAHLIQKAHDAQYRCAQATFPGTMVARAAQKADTDLPVLRDRLAALAEEALPYEIEFGNRGGWTRYFLVNNADGHVHSSTTCSTCRPATAFKWLTEQSGMTAAELIELAGEGACTVCFPDAPVDTLRRPSAFRSDVDVARDAARAEREAARAARAKKAAEKAITNPDGTPLVVPWLSSAEETIRTEATAWRELVDEHYTRDIYGTPFDERAERKVRLLVAALAHKLGITEADVLERMATKLAAKHRREGR